MSANSSFTLYITRQSTYHFECETHCEPYSLSAYLVHLFEPSGVPFGDRLPLEFECWRQAVVLHAKPLHKRIQLPLDVNLLYKLETPQLVFLAELNYLVQQELLQLHPRYFMPTQLLQHITINAQSCILTKK